MDFGNVLITGGAGFIGSHLADQLVNQNVHVTVMDNFSTGKKSNLVNCIENKNFELIEDDLKNQQNAQRYLNDVKSVFHMAADPEVRTGFSDPHSTYQKNIVNTFQLLENIRRANIEHLIFASSSVVYGEPDVIPTPESYGPLVPISIYGGTKLACEGLISSYCSNYGIKGTIVRFANVVGKRARHGVIWDFINKLKNDQRKLEVLGNGKQTKSYIHVNDCVEGLLYSSSKTENIDVFNLGNHDMINVLEIASIVCESMNLENVNIVTSGGTEDGRGWIGDIKEMNLDISKLTKSGWTPKENSKDAIKRAVNELMKKTF